MTDESTREIVVSDTFQYRVIESERTCGLIMSIQTRVIVFARCRFTSISRIKTLFNEFFLMSSNASLKLQHSCFQFSAVSSASGSVRLQDS